MALRLNIGSGDHYAPGWANIDTQPDVHPDVVASAVDLPYPTGSVDALYAGHVLEHLDWDGARLALAEFHRVLRPGGLLCVVGPDSTGVQPGTQLHHDIVHGGHRWAGDEHRWECTAPKLLELVSEHFPDASQTPIADVPEAWPVVSRIWWQAAVTATR